MAPTSDDAKSSGGRSRIDRAKNAKPDPMWPKLLAAFGMPLVGGIWVAYVLITGQARLDMTRLDTWGWKIALGSVCIGISVAMIWVRFGPGRDNLGFLSRVAAPVVALAAALAGFYIVAPPWLTRPVDQFFFTVNQQTNTTIEKAVDEINKHQQP